MVRSEGLLIDREGAFVERFCLYVVALGFVKQCQVVEAGNH